MSKIFGKPSDGPADNGADLAEMIASRSTLLDSMSKGFIAKAMKLLVAMSTILTVNDYQRLGPHLWEHVQIDGDSSSTTSVCLCSITSTIC